MITIGGGVEKRNSLNKVIKVNSLVPRPAIVTGIKVTTVEIANIGIK